MSLVIQAEPDVLNSHAKHHLRYFRSLEGVYCGDRLAELWTT